MPVTLPAHAAAVLPFFGRRTRWLPPAALVMGACAPDLSYVLRQRGPSVHSLEGLFVFCLPVGLLALAWWTGWVLPVLERVMPPVRGVELLRFLRTRPLPSTVKGWALTAVAILVGAATHLLWDGFTHRHQWPASELYPLAEVRMGGLALPLTRVLQHLSSLVGSLVVLAAMARRYPTLPPAPGGSWARAWPLFAWVGAGAGAGLALRLSAFQPMGALEAQLWWLFWPCVSGALLGLTVACGVLRAPRRAVGA